ncbi:hypothetical protein PanWU01x14_024550 [Parasponia andersonii]|uniref:Uncharacterized protein n=1 Tax=Parasponia andersonii TaxID=3476 RepID=A0A2P5DWQ8_PARAD|nr:hypothetical protein PanWU01x14_024550 [Parasponia andersonii]
MSRWDHQLNLMPEENKKRDEDRRFQSIVLDLLLWSKTLSHSGGESRMFGNMKLSSGDVKLNNSKDIDVDRDSILLETNKSILKSGLLTGGRKKKGRSKSSGSSSKMSNGNGQLLKYKVGPFKFIRKLNAPRDSEVLEYIFDEPLQMR